LCAVTQQPEIHGSKYSPMLKSMLAIRPECKYAI